MHIGLAGPIATSDAAALIDGPTAHLPEGSAGAPLMVTLIDTLLRRGHQVSAFTLSNGMPLRKDSVVVARGRNFALYYCANRPRAWPPNGLRPGRIIDLYAFERAGLGRAMASARPDVVHAHWSYEYAWAVLRTGLPHVVTCHDAPFVIARFDRKFRHSAYRWLRALIAWHVLRHAAHVTAVSPYMVAQVQPMCRVPVALIANPMSAPAQLPEQRSGGGAFRVVMVCNGFGSRKNAATGMHAFTLFGADRPDAELHLYGHDFEPGGLAERWWRSNGLAGAVTFHGAVSHKRILGAMCTGHVLLHPALEESFGAVLAEALSLELPVVAGIDSGAVPWVVGDAGWLVDVRRPEPMADAMRAIAKDPQAARERTRRGRAQVLSRFEAGAVVDQYEQQYAAALGAFIPFRTPSGALS